MTNFDDFIENILEQGLFSRLASKFKKTPAPEKKPYAIKKEWGKGKTHFAITPSSPNPEAIKPSKEWGAGRTHFAIKPKQLPSVPKKSPEETITTKSGTTAKARTQFMDKPQPKPLPSVPKKSPEERTASGAKARTQFMVKPAPKLPPRK
jgi:hypothetical protein